MRFAIIENDIVSNVIECDAIFAKQLGAIEIPDEFGVGDTYQNGVYEIGNRPEPEPTPTIKPTLSVAIQNKIIEINIDCENTIVAGVDYQSLVGLQHYSLTAYDQTNIMALASEAKQGKAVPYHANGEICRFYEPAEFLGLVATAMYCITYNTTYANLLKHQVADMTNVDDVLAVTYGVTRLTEEYQARLDEILEVLKNAETTT